MYSQVLTSTLKKVSLEKARKKKKKRKKNFCRKRLCLHTMTFEEHILDVDLNDITKDCSFKFRKVLGPISCNFPRSAYFFHHVIVLMQFLQEIGCNFFKKLLLEQKQTMCRASNEKKERRKCILKF
jgi:hypothetical protein